VNPGQNASPIRSSKTTARGFTKFRAKAPLKESAFHPGLKSGVSMKVYSYKAILLTPDFSLGPKEHKAMTLTPGFSLGPKEHKAMTLTPDFSLGPKEHKAMTLTPDFSLGPKGHKDRILTPDFSLGILKTLMNYSPGFSPE
jgi:hypothetical protein